MFLTCVEPRAGPEIQTKMSVEKRLQPFLWNVCIRRIANPVENLATGQGDDAGSRCWNFLLGFYNCRYEERDVFQNFVDYRN
jgi:hypothetical protein